MDCNLVILAAGKGERMKSDLSKPLHKVAGLPMIEWVKRAGSNFGEPIVVYGANGDELKNALDGCAFAEQHTPLGTGDAVRAAADTIKAKGAEYVVVIASDMPLVRKETLNSLYENAVGKSAHFLYGHVDDATGYGRVVKTSNGYKIVEHDVASAEQREIKDVNVSMYCFNAKDLLAYLPRLPKHIKKSGGIEYYLTDIIELMCLDRKSVTASPLCNMEESYGVNSQAQLSKAAELLRERINSQHLSNGVVMIDPKCTYIETDVSIGRGTIVYPGVILEGSTHIGENCTLYQGSRIKNSTVGDNTVIENSVINDSAVGNKTQIGPYAYLRPGSKVGDGCRVGDFVEVKNSEIGDGSKVSHLSYIGDGTIGKGVNVGCGVVFVNYDGKTKARVTVGDNSFIGCNTNLISPVNVGAGAYIAAGATVTKDIPDNALCIARAREIIKSGWGAGRFVKK